MRYSFSILLLIASAQCVLQNAYAQNRDDFWGIGRSVAGILSSGLNTFFESHFKDTPKNKKHQIKEFRHTHENLSADDLFSSLSELWETKENKQRRKIGEVPNEEIHLNKEQNKKTKSEKQKIYKNETKIKLNLELLEKNDREIKDAQEEKIKINQEKPAKVENKNNQEKININDTGEELKLNQEELKSNEKQNISFHLTPPKKFVEENETNINHWMRIRAIVENMKSIFLQTYGENSRDKLEILNMLDKMMEIGDKINAIRNIEDTFDNNLLEFLKSKWIDMKSDIISSNPVLNALLSIDGKILLLEIAKGLVRQFGQTFHKQAFAHIREQDFVIETMRQSGFKDSEIYEVFDLLDLPKDLLVSSSETLQTQFEGQYRFFGAVQGRGGGHGGHGGGHGGYYSMMKKDPLLLLAGLAFAIFAAYVIYRLLSSTPAPAKRSSDIFNTLTLTDMPEFVTKVYSWLENAEKLYRSSDEEYEFGEEENVISSVNALWRSFEADKNSKDCVRRYLCHHLKTNALKILRYGTTFEQVTILSLAELIGLKGAGKLVDSYVERLSIDKAVDCKPRSNSCDNKKFRSVIED